MRKASKTVLGTMDGTAFKDFVSVEILENSFSIRIGYKCPKDETLNQDMTIKMSIKCLRELKTFLNSVRVCNLLGDRYNPDV